MILNSESFELRILKKKRRLLVEQFKKGVKRILHFTLPAQEAKTGQPLAPILGQVQINTFDFVAAFNTKTQEFSKGTLIYVELIVLWDKTYTINIKPFSFQFFVHEFLFTAIYVLQYKNQSGLVIFIGDVFKLTLLYQKLTYSSSLENSFKTVLGCLNSFNVAISLFSEEDYMYNICYFLSNFWDVYVLLEKNLKGFGVYNQNLNDILDLLQNDLVFFEDREPQFAEEPASVSFSEEPDEILEY